jgi:hypothetical protein
MFPGGKGGRCVGLTNLPLYVPIVLKSGSLILPESSGPVKACNGIALPLPLPSAFILGGRRGTRTPQHFVNLTAESKDFRMLEFPLNQLQTYYGYLCDLLSFM